MQIRNCNNTCFFYGFLFNVKLCKFVENIVQLLSSLQLTNDLFNHIHIKWLNESRNNCRKCNQSQQLEWINCVQLKCLIFNLIKTKSTVVTRCERWCLTMTAQKISTAITNSTNIPTIDIACNTCMRYHSTFIVYQ